MSGSTTTHLWRLHTKLELGTKQLYEIPLVFCSLLWLHLLRWLLRQLLLLLLGLLLSTASCICMGFLQVCSFAVCWPC
jgi:hypothetical protein